MPRFVMAAIAAVCLSALALGSAHAQGRIQGPSGTEGATECQGGRYVPLTYRAADDTIIYSGCHRNETSVEMPLAGTGAAGVLSTNNGASLPADNSSSGNVAVSGYTRADGTYVAAHMRSAPNSTTADNLSTSSNVNL